MNTKIAVSLCMTWFCCFVQAQDSNVLRWKFVEGDSFQVKLGQTSNIKSNVNDRKVSTGQEVQVWMEWAVDSIDDRSAKMTWKFTRVASKSETVQATKKDSGDSAIPEVIEFDSDADEPENLAAKKLWKGVKPLIDQPFEVTMTDRGEIIDVTIPTKTMEALREFSGSMRVRRLMEEEGIKEVIGQSMCVLPEEEAKPGYTWSSTRTFDIPMGKIRQVTTYTYQGDSTDSENPGLVINVSSEAAVDSFVEDGRPKLEIKSQNSSGKIRLDNEAGFVKSADVSAKMETVTPYRDMEILATMETNLKLNIEKN